MKQKQSIIKGLTLVVFLMLIFSVHTPVASAAKSKNIKNITHVTSLSKLKKKTKAKKVSNEENVLFLFPNGKYYHADGIDFAGLGYSNTVDELYITSDKYSYYGIRVGMDSAKTYKKIAKKYPTELVKDNFSQWCFFVNDNYVVVYADDTNKVGLIMYQQNYRQIFDVPEKKAHWAEEFLYKELNLGNPPEGDDFSGYYCEFEYLLYDELGKFYCVRVAGLIDDGDRSHWTTLGRFFIGEDGSFVGSGSYQNGKLELYNSVDENDAEDFADDHAENDLKASDSEYHYSSNRYFNIYDSYDDHTKEIMSKFNAAADETEAQGIKQAAFEHGKLAAPSVRLVPENTYFNPDTVFCFNGLYEISNMNLLYYVKPDSYYSGMGSNEWELVINYFMEALLSYQSIKEAKKFVNVAIGGNGDSWSKNEYDKVNSGTDIRMASLLTFEELLRKAHSNSVSVFGTYSLENLKKTDNKVKVTVNPYICAYYYEKVDQPKSKSPDNIYMNDYMLGSDDILYSLHMGRSGTTFNLTLLLDDYGEWKIVSIE
ncbi:MAG: hypothetical protein K6E85_01930 [Lachnospiraceae bacterium]|nr:hypothetical protein [Lachnospiraceae bacterium]